MLVFLMLFVLILVITVYVLQAIFLSKFNKLVYGKGTALAWVPICNIYLLGKLTVNKLVGWRMDFSSLHFFNWFLYFDSKWSIN